MSVYIFSALFVLGAYVIACINNGLVDTADKVDAVEESIKTLSESHKEDSRYLYQLSSTILQQNKNIETINKLIAELKKHTGYQIQEVANTVAKEFTGEKA